jgi:hypothetical protein
MKVSNLDGSFTPKSGHGHRYFFGIIGVERAAFLSIARSPRLFISAKHKFDARNYVLSNFNELWDFIFKDLNDHTSMIAIKTSKKTYAEDHFR